MFEGRKKSFSSGSSKSSKGTEENLVPVHLKATSHGTFLSGIIDGEDIIAIISGFGS